MSRLAKLHEMSAAIEQSRAISREEHLNVLAYLLDMASAELAGILAATLDGKETARPATHAKSQDADQRSSDAPVNPPHQDNPAEQLK